MERRGHEEVLHYQFSDLDLTAEVDQKKLLIELYDRGLISKCTLQQKMGLSSAVEAKQHGDPELIAQALLSGDPEVDLETVGREVGPTRRDRAPRSRGQEP